MYSESLSFIVKLLVVRIEMFTPVHISIPINCVLTRWFSLIEWPVFKEWTKWRALFNRNQATTNWSFISKC